MNSALLWKVTRHGLAKNLDFYLAFRMQIGYTIGAKPLATRKQTSPKIVQIFGLHTLNNSTAKALKG
jgi:hypothetical protein